MPHPTPVKPTKRYGLRVGLLLLLFLPLFITPAAAAPAAPGGLSALVISTGAEQEVRFKFPLASDDTDQDAGDFQYNLTLDSGSPVDLGDIETLGAAVVVGSGFIAATVTISGATDEYDAWIHAWDGMAEGADSCTVNFTTAAVYDYDSCSSMDPTYEEEWCFSVEKDEDFNFNDYYRVSKRSSTGLRFGSFQDESAWAGVRLGGDTNEYNFTFEIQSASEGGTTRALMFWSTVSTEVNENSAGNAAETTSVDKYPNTGAFRNGYGLTLKEDGNNYIVTMYYNSLGSTTIIGTEELSSGVIANSNTVGGVRISPYLDLFEVTLGNEEVRFSLDEETPGPGNFQSFWLAEYGTGFFNVAAHYQTTDGTSGCLSSIAADLGGASAITGGASDSQNLEDFDGQGGFGGAPEFPGLDVQGISDSLGSDPKYVGYFLAAILVMAGSILGFVTAGGAGAGVGMALTTVGSTVLNLTPYWFLITLLIGSITIVVLSFKGGGG